MTDKLQTRAIRKCAAWPGDSGALYGAQVRTIKGDDGPVEMLIAQGYRDSSVAGDPHTLWLRHAGEADFTFRRVISAPDRHFPLIYPQVANAGAGWMATTKEERVGACGVLTWYRRADGLFERWTNPAIGNPPTVVGGYQREFVLQLERSFDGITWWTVAEDNDSPNLSLRRAALRLTDTITPADRYDGAHGISGGGGFIESSPELVQDGMPPAAPATTPKSAYQHSARYLYLMLKVFHAYDRESQKNLLVRKDLNKPVAVFEVWLATWTAKNIADMGKDAWGLVVEKYGHFMEPGTEPKSFAAWLPCTNGLIPAELQSDWGTGNPKAWPIDYIGETPFHWRARGRYMAVTGQPMHVADQPQIRILFSNTPTSWPDEKAIDVVLPFRIAGLNYRTYNPDGGLLYFASSDTGLLKTAAGGKVTTPDGVTHGLGAIIASGVQVNPADETAGMQTFELEAV